MKSQDPRQSRATPTHRLLSSTRVLQNTKSAMLLSNASGPARFGLKVAHGMEGDVSWSGATSRTIARCDFWMKTITSASFESHQTIATETLLISKGDSFP